MRNLHFIVNQLSPNAARVKSEVQRYFNMHEYLLTIKLSKYKGHTIELTMASISEGAQTIVACGGDGTVNEVAQCLVNKPVSMGILPIGSGNGLARHLGIPTRLSSALRILKQSDSRKMDVGRINDRYFFCNFSVAFSAQVIHCYDQVPQRGMKAYFRAFLKAVSSFKYSSFELLENDESLKSTPFLLLLSNTDQLGYNRTLTPDASLFDGKLDMIRVERSNLFLLSLFMVFAFFRKFPSFTRIHRKQLEAITLLGPDQPLKIQIDGESLEWNVPSLNVKVLPKSLEIICPRP
ncbi:YegS/Rv2252/BmrU family lipid kinase [Flavobacteriaceae bacterium TP-CH-4]|uniref:YegS/Rv2252/BmrU family lipid kinase n=1 Tax=Pelagihabitans pacificus TaxID=2696054 RepID=A0A967EA48_9FLAO|nr:YegS/Rv2252/BmrU family lipid kinase [Pelagihabitans pacificus]NHF59086.1 YegS/Rv2252/BmrU family lipid kinase [Pelagihabitans pacificus]